MKHVLLRLTGRNLRDEQTLREVLIRFGMGAFASNVVNTRSMITKHFEGHHFAELELVTSEQIAEEEVQAFVAGLQKWGYKEGTDWTRDKSLVKFCTLPDTLQVFQKYF